MRTRKEVRNDDVRRVYDFFWSLSNVLALPHDGFSAALPKSTQKILKDLKLDPSILDGVDKELQVPKGWMEKAKKEGKLKVRSTPITPKELKPFLAPFKERYPFIDKEYFGANRRCRTQFMRRLIASWEEIKVCQVGLT